MASRAALARRLTSGISGTDAVDIPNQQPAKEAAVIYRYRYSETRQAERGMIVATPRPLRAPASRQRQESVSRGSATSFCRTLFKVSQKSPRSKSRSKQSLPDPRYESPQRHRIPVRQTRHGALTMPTGRRQCGRAPMLSGQRSSRVHRCRLRFRGPWRHSANSGECPHGRFCSQHSERFR